jgi:hypothetical protein
VISTAPEVAHWFEVEPDGKLARVQSTFDDGRTWQTTYTHRPDVHFRFSVFPTWVDWLRGTEQLTPTRFWLSHTLWDPSKSFRVFELDLARKTAEEFDFRVLEHAGENPSLNDTILLHRFHFYNDTLGLAVNAFDQWGNPSHPKYKGDSHILYTRDGGRSWYRSHTDLPAIDWNIAGMKSLHMLEDGWGLALNRDCMPYITHKMGGLLVSGTAGKRPQPVSLYPNPARTTLHLELHGHEGGQLECYTPKGQRVFSQAVGLPDTTLDISTWPAGLYLWTWRASSGTTQSGKVLVVD